jgi:hypothetical protein
MDGLNWRKHIAACSVVVDVATLAGVAGAAMTDSETEYAETERGSATRMCLEHGDM